MLDNEFAYRALLSESAEEKREREKAAKNTWEPTVLSTTKQEQETELDGQLRLPSNIKQVSPSLPRHREAIGNDIMNNLLKKHFNREYSTRRDYT